MVSWALLGAACGEGGDIEGSESCTLKASFSGAIDTAIAPGSVACAVLASFDSGVEVGYLAPGATVERVDLSIDEVTEGETGTSFPAEVGIEVATESYTWVSCTATISEHEYVGPAELGDDYRVVGTVTCPVDAPADSGSPSTVSLDELEFVVTTSWN